jgi:hypothetical protein
MIFDITFNYDPRFQEHSFKAHSARGDAFLCREFEGLGDVSVVKMIEIADKARMAGLTVRE